MARRIRDVLQRRAAQGVVGRDQEIAALLAQLEAARPFVLHLHGIPGVGKSTLLRAAADRARRRGHAVVPLDCRAMEPTPRGFLHGLCESTGEVDPGLVASAERLGRLADRVMLALDSYEVFGLMDSWLREAFVPALADNVRVLLVGRHPPAPAWLTAPEWQALFKSLAIEPLGEAGSLKLLASIGLEGEEARHICRFAHGHPLALKLAGALVLEGLRFSQEDAGVHRVVAELAQTYLADIPDATTRATLQAACVVRRVTKPILAAMFPDGSADLLYQRLRGLSFVESTHDGLVIHEAVREPIAAALEAADPESFQGYRRAAWRHLSREIKLAGLAELWRYTADTIYLVNNPVVREAFFPTDPAALAVAPAQPGDGAAIQAITARHEDAGAARLIRRWWSQVPDAFRAVRDGRQRIVGFYCMFDPARAGSDALGRDPITASWWRHLQEQPMPPRQGALFLRRWLTEEQGEAPSPGQAACWLDIKRTYLELRPELRRVYLTLRDLAPYAAVAQRLGFRPLAAQSVALDGATYATAMLDFGPASVDGWLSGLLAAELGCEGTCILDSGAHELLLDGERVRLSKLEFGVMRYLESHEGSAVSRSELLREVWGHGFEGGSNVVDAVVYSLRRKLRGRAGAVQTVRGVGYLYRA